MQYQQLTVLCTLEMSEMTRFVAAVIFPTPTEKGRKRCRTVNSTTLKTLDTEPLNTVMHARKHCWLPAKT
jgi:hypothetical protein